MNNNYKNKYLKYKSKYLELKNSIQKGGMDTGVHIEQTEQPEQSKQSVKKVLDVFVPMFHSEQLSLKDMVTIPKGSILVKLELCGKSTYQGDNTNKILDDFYSNQEYLKYPNENKEKIKTIFGFYPNIVNEGESVSNILFGTSLFHYIGKHEEYNPDADHKYFECQGIMKNGINECNNSNKGLNYLPYNFNKITFNQIRLLYKNSIFPNNLLIEEVIKRLNIKMDSKTISRFVLEKSDDEYIFVSDFMKELDDLLKEIFINKSSVELNVYKKYLVKYDFNIKINLIEIMNDYPGVYYVISCRGGIEKLDPKDLGLQRSMSYNTREISLLDTINDCYEEMKPENNPTLVLALNKIVESIIILNGCDFSKPENITDEIKKIIKQIINLMYLNCYYGFTFIQEGPDYYRNKIFDYYSNKYDIYKLIHTIFIELSTSKFINIFTNINSLFNINLEVNNIKLKVNDFLNFIIDKTLMDIYNSEEDIKQYYPEIKIYEKEIKEMNNSILLSFLPLIIVLNKNKKIGGTFEYEEHKIICKDISNYEKMVKFY